MLGDRQLPTAGPDEVSVEWDGSVFRTADGIALLTPEWYVRYLPKDRLIGTLSMGSGRGEALRDAIRRARARDLEWARLTFNVHDMPDVDQPQAVIEAAIDKTIEAAQCMWQGDETLPGCAPIMQPMRSR